MTGMSSKLKSWWHGEEAAAAPPPAAAEPSVLTPPPEPPAAEPAAAAPIPQERRLADPAPVPPRAADAPPPARLSQTCAGKPMWDAVRVQVAEKMWGEDFVGPGGEAAVAELIKPFGLNKEMSVLNPGAGLGGAARFMARKYGSWVTGVEVSPMLAALGMERSGKESMAKQAPIVEFDPDNIAISRRYDCIFGQDAFLAVSDQDKLYQQLSACLKPGGQLMLVDYCLADDADPNLPILAAWAARELQTPYPQTIGATTERLKRNKLEVRIVDDQTPITQFKITKALGGLRDFLNTVSMPDTTKLAVLEEVELWAVRVAAFSAGLRYQRFFAIKR